MAKNVRQRVDTRPSTPNVNLDVNRQTRPNVDVNEITRPAPTVNNIDISALRQRRGESNVVGPSYGDNGSYSGGVDTQAIEAELERQRQEQERIRNENLRKEKDAEIARKAREKESEKRLENTDASGVAAGLLPEAAVTSKASKQGKSTSGTGVIAGHKWTTSNPVTGESWSHEILPDVDDEYNELYDDENYQYLLPDMDPDDWAELEEVPFGVPFSYYDKPAATSVSDVLDARARKEAREQNEDQGPVWKAPPKLTQREPSLEERLVYASEVGKRQRGKMDEHAASADRWDRLMAPMGKPRYKTISEIRDEAREFLESNPGLDYEFAGDRAFEKEWYDEDKTDEDIRKDITKAAGATWDDINSEIDSRRERPDTSIDTVRHGGAPNYDPNSTVSDNIKAVEDAIDGNARLIANPFLIKWGSERIEHLMSVSGKTLAKFRFNNTEGRNVEGAIGSVMRYYNCSATSVMRLVIRQLGLGIDTKGNICGVSANEFRLSDVLIIEACNDILTIAKANNGIPTGINVAGRPYGYSNSRDDTGMFPILGGTRCMPFGHIPLKTFEDISGPGSPLYMMSATQFYLQNSELFMNNVQPHMAANATGPLAYQAIAWNIANEGVLSIDGLPNEMYNIPEHQVYRTKAILEADLMDTSDQQCLEAKEQRIKNMVDIDSRMRRMHFKDGDSRSNSSDTDVEPGTLLGPGKDSRNGPLSNVLGTFTDIAAFCRAMLIELGITAPLENLVGIATQGTTISLQKVGKNIGKSLYHLNENFDRTDFLDSAITSDDAIEAIEVYQTLMRLDGRTAVQEFLIDRNDGNTDRRYKAATKANLYDFLKRWQISQTPEMVQRIEKTINFMMVGEGMLKKTKARQLLDMTLIEMQNNRIHGGEVFNSDNLEEIAHSGEHRYGAGEALVSAIIDSQGGYEAFKTMDYASLDRTTPATRAIDAVLRKNGVTETAFRYTICMFPRFNMSRITRAMPGYCTISYIMSDIIKRVAKVEGDAIAGEYSNDIVQSFADGFKQAAEAVQRISDYQVGMDSANFWVGLRKNMLYDATIFGANYIVMGAIKRAVIALFGGMEPPEDEQKVTLPWEWTLKLTGLPMKDAWFMDDLMGCGAPLAYAWEILDGYDIKDKDGNVVKHVDAYSDEAKTKAWQAYKNMIRTYGPTKDAIDAMEMITDFDEQIEEIMGKDIWRQSPAKSLEDFVGDIDKEMSEYYKDTDYDLTVDQMRMEWALGRAVGFAYDMFDELTPKIANQVLPGSRDSMVRDKYQHVAKLEYDYDNYDKKTAEEEYRVKQRPYLEFQVALRTRDNVFEAFFTDFLMNFFDNQSNFSYMEMPIRTSTDPRPRSENNFMNMWSLDSYFENGNMKPDITGPDGKPDGKEDTREERQEYLFDKAEELCEYINENYISNDRYPEWAVQNDHFIIPADIRAIAKDYCYYLLGSKNKMGQLEKDINARKEEMGGRVSSEEWADYQAIREKYSTILYDYLNNEKIPWRAPRYRKYESDTATMYVDSNGNATTWDDPDAHEIKYSYGNQLSALDVLMPWISPVDQGNYDYQGFTWDTLLDDNGRPISQNSMNNIYDQAVNAGNIVTGIGTGKSAIDVMSAGGEIERGNAPVAFDERGWEAMETTLPDWYSELDQDTINKKYGIDSYMPDDETNPDDPDSMKTDGKNASSMYNNKSYGGNSYMSYSGRGGSRGGYYYSSGGGGSNYNPKIYSNARNVYSQRAAGMRSSQPYRATTSYLRPAHYMSGSRKAYRRQY